MKEKLKPPYSSFFFELNKRQMCVISTNLSNLVYNSIVKEIRANTYRREFINLELRRDLNANDKIHVVKGHILNENNSKNS